MNKSKRRLFVKEYVRFKGLSVSYHRISSFRKSLMWIQNFYFDDQTVSVGIHDVAFKDDLNATLKELKVREKTNAGSKMAQ